MSLKKRMFRSNMTILCSALVSLMLIIIAVLLLFEDSFEQQFHSISQTALERHASEAAEAVEQTEIDEIDELNRRIGQWGYQAAVFSDGRVTAGESGGLMNDLAEFFAGDQGEMDGKTDVYSILGATAAAKYIPEEDSFLAAVYFPEENPLLSSLRQIHLSFMQEKEVMPEVPMDVDQVPRIFDNLLENSVKYAGVRPLEIRIQVFEQTGEKPGVIVEWKDNGHGVPEEKLPQIFERFYRCDESRSEKGGGIGLYVVKYIMERHGGSVKAENDGGLKIQLFFPKEET